MKIFVNDQEIILAERKNLTQLLEELKIDPGRVACELNYQVVKRPEYPNTFLNEGDKLEIIQFIGGG